MRNILFSFLTIAGSAIAQTPRETDAFVLGLEVVAPQVLKAARELQKDKKYKHMSIRDICESDQLRVELILTEVFYRDLDILSHLSDLKEGDLQDEKTSKKALEDL